MNTTLIVGKTYFIQGRFYNEDDEPQSLDECKFIVRDGTRQIIFEAEALPVQEGVYGYAYPITLEKGIGPLLIGFEGMIGGEPEATERIRVERAW